MSIAAIAFIPQTKESCSPLTVACGKNRLQVAQLLISNGANINYNDGVCDNYHCNCFHTFKECFPQQNGNSPLHRASEEGHPEVVKLLVQSHAIMNVKNNVSIESPH